MDNNIANPPAPALPEPVSVSELSHTLKRTVEKQFDFVRVRGELSKVKIYGSGHLYTDLKDENAVINAVCWRGVVKSLAVGEPREGMEVICTGKITTYPARSNYQLVIETMEPAGEGALLKYLEDLKKRLQAEGLFDPSRKKKLPFLPRRIGIVTSPSGAVIHDILHRLQDRFPVHVLLWPATVQGANTAREVVAGIEAFNRLSGDLRPDVLIVARGGGSIEDLMPFNEEPIIRAVAASDIPVISGVGHETDTTFIDYAADYRAPTPSAAAEKAVPVRDELYTLLTAYKQRLHMVMSSRLRHERQEVRDLHRRLGDPVRILDSQFQKLDYIQLRAREGLNRILHERTRQLARATVPHPRLRLEHCAGTLHRLGQRLAPVIARNLEARQKQLAHSGAMLETLSFRKTLARGYTVVRDKNGHVLTSAAAARQQKKITVVFADDSIEAAPVPENPQGSLF